MGRRWWVLGIAMVAGVAAVAFPDRSDCTAQAASTTPPITSTENPLAAAPRTAEAPAPDLSTAVARAVEAGAGAALGLAAVDLDTGAAAGHNADTRSVRRR